MGENMRQGHEKAKNLKRNLTLYHKCKETAAWGTETLIHGTARSSTFWNGSCNRSQGEVKLVNG